MSKPTTTQPPLSPAWPIDPPDPMQGAADAISALHKKMDEDWERRNRQKEPGAPVMPVEPAIGALKLNLDRCPETFKVNEQETEEDGENAGRMRLARWQHQNRELARLSAEARQAQMPPAGPQLMNVDSPLQQRLQEMPLDKMKGLIKLRTQRGSEQAASLNKEPTGLKKQPIEAAPSMGDLARQPLVRGHFRYPVGGQMGGVPEGEPGAWLRKPPEASTPKWRHWVANLIARLKGF